MSAFERRLFSREQWLERSRFVVVPNREAKDVFTFFGVNVCYARHVFAQDQTVLVEQFRQIGEAA